MTDRKQLLITAPYRTGSTWFSLLLNNHPSSIVIGLHTTNFLRENHGHAFNAVEYARKRWDVTLERPELLNYSAHRDVNPMVHWFIALQAIFGDHDVLGEKMQLEWTRIPDVLGSLSSARAILLLRDPRSILASWREYDRYDPPNYRQAAFVALSAMQHASRYEDSLSEKRFRTVRYEDLARSTAEVLCQLCHWLGVEWPGSDVMLSTDGWQDVPGVQWGDRSSFSEPDEIDVDRAVHRWKGTTTDDEVRFVETVCGPEMEAHGYEPVSESLMDERELRDYCAGDELLMEMLGRWLETGGEGTEAFPRDPTDESTWQENQQKETA